MGVAAPASALTLHPQNPGAKRGGGERLGLALQVGSLEAVTGWVDLSEQDILYVLCTWKNLFIT